jgi:glycosyltransferase involved in cell wall biosynthesis
MIALMKKYADAVYVLYEGKDSRVSELAGHSPARVIDFNARDPLVKQIGPLGEDDVIIAMYGDGTHDPGVIPALAMPLYAGYDVVVCPEAGRAFPEHTDGGLSSSGLFACTGRYFNGLAAFSGTAFESVLLSPGSLKGHKVKLVDATGKDPVEALRVYRIGVVVPAFNEEKLIQETLNGIPSYVDRIYVIDDASRDRTYDIIKSLKDPRLRPVHHTENRGVGAAIVAGYKLALEDGMDVVAVMAGDNQMDPEQLSRLLMPILEGKADYTKGNRLSTRELRVGMSRWRAFGNFLLAAITNIGSGYWQITDPQNGYTAISRAALKAIDPDSIYTYYGYCNDMLIKLNARGLRTIDVAIPARYGSERSSIKYGKYVMKVAPMIFRGFLWRLKTKYIMRGLHPLVFFYGMGIVMAPLGLLLCSWALASSILLSPVSGSFVLLATLITLAGLQSLALAMLFDMQASRDWSRVEG